MEYRFLGSTGLRVSELFLGCMTFPVENEESVAFRILDRYVAAGGTVIDTANNYQNSEEVIGRWLKARGTRADLVVCTKVRFPIEKQGPNDVGLSRVHIMSSVERSLRRLGTDWIDLYQAHCWDHVTPVDETLRTFDDLVSSGKVRYIGASNFTGWQLVKSLYRADAARQVRYVNVQSQYSLLTRSPEWELLPACREERIGLTAWSPLAAGWLSGKYRRDAAPPADSRLAHGARTLEEWKRLQTIAVGSTIPHPHQIEAEEQYQSMRKDRDENRKWMVIDAVAEIARVRGKSSSQVALAWLCAQKGLTAPVLGVRTLGQLEDNLGAVGWKLDDREMEWLNQVSDPGLPYPLDFWEQYGRPWR